MPSRLIGTLVLFSIGVTAQVSFPGPELLGRPTDHSITLNVVPSTAIEAYFEYGTSSGGPYLSYPNSGPANPLSGVANAPLVVVLDGLAPDTRYFYRMVYRQIGAGGWITRPEHTFQTQRTPGSTFTFTITSDSHLNILLGTASIFQQTMQNVANGSPDFHLDLGDTFPMDGVTTQATANNNYLGLRPHFGQASHSTPIMIVLGNHEQNEAWHLNDTGNPATSPPVLSTNARNRYYLNPNPLLDAFYSGNRDTSVSAITGDHILGDYYAWTWGDALFVAIDPYWYSTTKPFIGNVGGGEPGAGSGDRWDWTLGVDQYRWLKQTLETSNAKFKFIFAHQVPGGTSDYGRGGANAVPYFELGGFNADGTTYAFEVRRPGWSTPVHQLLVANHVTAFFHGHDHEFAYEQRDGVIYQLVPMAADATNGFGFNEYRETDPFTIKVLPNSGYLRVTVSPAQATVDYVKTGGGANGQVAYSYAVAASAASPLTITSPPSLPAGVVGVPYGVIPFSASGGTGSYTWSATGLPSGMVLDSHGALGGTPAGGSQGNYSVQFAVRDFDGVEARSTLAFTINAATAAPAISSISPNPAPGMAGTQQVTINGSGFQNGPGLKVHLTNGGYHTDVTDSQLVFVSTSQLALLVDLDTNAANWTAQVINPDGGLSNLAFFTVGSQLAATTFVLPQLVFGDGWYTALYFSNNSGVSATIQVNFIGNDGTPLTVPLTGIGPVTSRTLSLDPGATVILEAPIQGVQQQGWVEAVLPPGVNGYAVFRLRVQGRADQEAVVLLTPSTNQVATLVYDEADRITAAAFANPSNQPTTLTITALDSDGVELGSARVVMPARSKQAIELRRLNGLAGMVGKRGLVIFSVPNGAVAAMGVRFGSEAFTSIPQQ